MARLDRPAPSDPGGEPSPSRRGWPGSGGPVPWRGPPQPGLFLGGPAGLACNPGEVTGYAVALPAGIAKAGAPVWYSGGKLAPDLTPPKLRHRPSQSAARSRSPAP